MADRFPHFTTKQILASRPVKNRVDPQRPYAHLVEPEHSAYGGIVDVATLFLTNAECPFHCLMCDLWKNTIERDAQPPGIPTQIRFALENLPAAKEIKLYNSGNFFDPIAIPVVQHSEIAELVRDFETVVVENHPRLTNESCLAFRDAIAPAQLEVAIGLETCHPELLASLNKSMTLDDYERAVRFLVANEIRVRTFILLKPPFLSEAEGVEWAIRSMNFAFDLGVNCCAVIPTRGGNGIMEQLASSGDYSPPAGESLEFVLEEGLKIKRGRVFVDLWDAEQFFGCPECRQQRIDRLNQMNLSQQCVGPVRCLSCKS